MALQGPRQAPGAPGTDPARLETQIQVTFKICPEANFNARVWVLRVLGVGRKRQKDKTVAVLAQATDFCCSHPRCTMAHPRERLVPLLSMRRGGDLIYVYDRKLAEVIATPPAATATCNEDVFAGITSVASKLRNAISDFLALSAKTSLRFSTSSGSKLRRSHS